MCNTQPIRNSRSLEITPKVAGIGNTQLPPDDYLEAQDIKAIAAYTVTNIPVGPNTGTALQAAADFNSSFLTLVSGSDEVIARIPLVQICPQLNNGIIRPIEIKKLAGAKRFSLTKSYITSQSAGTVTTKIYLLEFYFDEK